MSTLADRLRNRCAVAPLRFDEWMSACLYDPADGFYSQHGMAGRARGDFVTSPEVGPLFGELMVEWAERRWVEAGRPERFDVVDVGAGRGALTIAMRSAAGGAFGAAVRWTTVEVSDRLREHQREHLGDLVDRRAEMPDRVCGVVIANELLDNLPVRLFQRVGDGRTSSGWAEVGVEWGGDRFVPVLASSVVPASLLAIDAPVGTRLPVYAAASTWVESTRRKLTGALVCLDYGVARLAELVERDGDWLRTYAEHEVGFDPFVDPGRCDITVDVAADQLDSGSGSPVMVCSQAEFLGRLSLDERLAEARVAASDPSTLRSLAGMRLRSRLNEAAALCDSAGLGGFLAMSWSGL